MLGLENVFDEYPNPFFIIRPILSDGLASDFEYIYVNKALCLFLGRSYDELVGRRFSENFKKKGEKVWLRAFTKTAVDKQHFFMSDVSNIIRKKLYTEFFHIEPDLCGCIIHDYKDISATIHQSENSKLAHRANYDYLTGFYNRFYLREQYDTISKQENVGVTFLDINNLKITNDTRGHAAGDDLITMVSDKIRKIYKDSMVFRMGGDEFLIITTGLGKDEFLRLSEDGRKEFEKNNLAAVGCGFYEHIDKLRECIHECDARMYAHKNKMKML
jgi:diguanylate cyclase (GGDEF)-like protein